MALFNLLRVLKIYRDRSLTVTILKNHLYKITCTGKKGEQIFSRDLLFDTEYVFLVINAKHKDWNIDT